MTQHEIEALAQRLRAKQGELSGSLWKRDEIAIENASDVFDQVQLMRERELAVQNLDRDSNILRQIHRALSRIDRGIFGVCLHCGEDIAHRRMAAVPWAAFCIKCQEKIDRGEIKPEDTLEEFAPAA